MYRGTEIRLLTKRQNQFMARGGRYNDGTTSDDEWAGQDTRSGREGQRIAVILRSFNYEDSLARQSIREKFSTGIGHRELCSVAILISQFFGVSKIPRDARRSFPVLIKWFDDHWAMIEPIWSCVSLLDESEVVIDYARELRETARV
jgi:hypothetical protein